MGLVSFAASWRSFMRFIQGWRCSALVALLAEPSVLIPLVARDATKLLARAMEALTIAILFLFFALVLIAV